MQRKLLHTASPKIECIFSQWKIFDVWEKNITRGCSGKWMFLANCYPTPLYRKVWDLYFLHAILQWLRKYYESLLESLITFMMHFKRLETKLDWDFVTVEPFDESRKTIWYKSRQLLKSSSVRDLFSQALRSNINKSEKFVMVDMVQRAELLTILFSNLWDDIPLVVVKLI